MTAYTVNDAMVEAAARLEKSLDPIRDKIVDPPMGEPNRCIAPCFHPDLFAPKA